MLPTPSIKTLCSKLAYKASQANVSVSGASVLWILANLKTSQSCDIQMQSDEPIFQRCVFMLSVSC